MAKNNLIKARWLLTLIFPLGFLFTQDAFSEVWGTYVLLNFLSFVSCGILMWHLRKVSLENMVIWFIVMVLLVGYYYKFYFLVNAIIHDRSKIELSLIIGSFAPFFVSGDILMECFAAISFSFFAVAVASHFLLRKKKTSAPFKFSFNTNINWVEISSTLIYIAMLLWVVSGVLRAYYQLGVPLKAAHLPYKLAGLITVTNGIITPMLISMALLSALRSGKERPVLLTTWIFIVWGVVEYLLFMSKTFLVIPIIIIYAAGILYGRPILKTRYMAWYGGVFLFVYPFLNVYRSIHYFFQTKDTFTGITETARFIMEAMGDIGIFAFFINGITSMTSRVTGLDSMIVIAFARNRNPEASIMDFLMGRVRSAEEVITGMHNIPNTGVGASFLGQAYFVTGSYFLTALWTAGWLVLAYWITVTLMKRDNLFAHNAVLFWLIMVLQWSIDAITYLKIEVFVFAVLVSSLIAHFVEIGQRRAAVRINRS